MSWLPANIHVDRSGPFRVGQWLWRWDAVQEVAGLISSCGGSIPYRRYAKNVRSPCCECTLTNTRRPKLIWSSPLRVPSWLAAQFQDVKNNTWIWLFQHIFQEDFSWIHSTTFTLRSFAVLCTIVRAPIRLVFFCTFVRYNVEGFTSRTSSGWAQSTWDLCCVCCSSIMLRDAICVPLASRH